MVRFPDGTGGEAFFEKNLPRGAPEWVQTVTLPSSGSRSGRGPGTITYPLIADLPSLVWTANRRARAPRPPVDRRPRAEAPRAGPARVRPRPRRGRQRGRMRPGGRAAAGGAHRRRAHPAAEDQRLEGSAGVLRRAYPQHGPDLGLCQSRRRATGRRDARTGGGEDGEKLRADKVFIDWSQNNPAKTTIAPYSLRGRDTPTASTPITWHEVRACRTPAELTFTAEDVLHRVVEHGDLLAQLDATRVALPSR